MLPNSSYEATRSLIPKQDKALQKKRENYRGFLGGSVVKNLPANAGDGDLILGLGRSPGEGNDNPLQYSCGESYGQRNLVVFISWHPEELDTIWR